MRRISTGALALALATGAAAQQQNFFMVTNSTSPEAVLLMNADNGDLLDASWINDQGASGWALVFPKSAIQVGDEVWVSDQNQDSVHRFAVDQSDPILSRPVYVGSITGDGVNEFDNIRGLSYDGERVYLTMWGPSTNFFYNSVIVIDAASATVVDSWPTTGSPFDVQQFDGDLLVSGSSPNTVVRFSKTGQNLGTVVPTGVLSTAQQILNIDDNEFLVMSSLGLAQNRGIYRYNAAGEQIEFIPTSAQMDNATARGVAQIPGGGYLVSSNNGVYAATSTGSGSYLFTQLVSGVGFDGHFIGRLTIGAPDCPPDLNGDGVVDADDFFLFLQLFAAGDMRADFNNDGVIDADDFFAFLSAFAQGC
ncbi:MAG: hypothetical protein JJU33_07230 [Phycisphaerales bacterium]|nr:hypothetical protein [Phycisphaerales bacterium]